MPLGDSRSVVVIDFFDVQQRHSGVRRHNPIFAVYSPAGYRPPPLIIRSQLKRLYQLRVGRFPWYSFLLQQQSGFVLGGVADE